MKKYISLLTVVLIMAYVPDALADSGDPIFSKLAGKADKIGSGLRNAGFIIAGLGMVMFTFMAIFNKLSWKHLFYIMLSTAVLSASLAAVQFAAHGGRGDGIKNISFSSPYGSGNVSGDTRGVSTRK